MKLLGDGHLGLGRISVIAVAMSAALVVGACGGGGGAGGADIGNPAPLNGSAQKVNVFYTGHSLVDDPLAANTEAIASSLGRSTRWNEQIVLGSPVRTRTRGDDNQATDFPGYSSGKNRDGGGMNVVDELSTRASIGGEAYHAVVLAERHDIAQTLEYEDTVRYTRHFHDRAVQGSPGVNTYVYHAWWNLYDRDNPQPWIDLERSATTVWQCVASRINQSLAGEGRSERLRYMPAGLALAEAIDAGVRGGLPGISADSPRETVARMMRDEVHLTPLGVYYMSLVNYASLFRASPVGAWAPEGVTAEQRQTLQAKAWEVVGNYYAREAEPSMDSCRAHMRDRFCTAFYGYDGRAAQSNRCVAYFTATSSANPFYFDAASDASYWLTGP
jgi:hypothetical protein